MTSLPRTQFLHNWSRDSSRPKVEQRVDLRQASCICKGNINLSIQVPWRVWLPTMGCAHVKLPTCADRRTHRSEQSDVVCKEFDESTVGLGESKVRRQRTLQDRMELSNLHPASCTDAVEIAPAFCACRCRRNMLAAPAPCTEQDSLLSTKQKKKERKNENETYYLLQDGTLSAGL